ncbi:MAG: hypothetical protein Q8P67_20815 [archaeon]|nr:hypothetical protein [archaeon]
MSVPSQHTGAWLTALKSTGAGLHRSQLPLVRQDEEDASRRVLVLSEALSASLKARGLPSADGVSREALPEALSLALREEGLLREARLRECLVTVTARHLNLQEMLRQSLPEGLPEPPSAYETVGHIAHVNLRDEFLPYRFLIGEAILLKNRRLRTVVNKTGSIDSRYRTFAMELLAGEAQTVTRHYENECLFEFDFAKVYWNSRLQTEHERVVGLLRGATVIDLMAGVGPFAIPASKRGAAVHANDLNPDSYASLCANARINKIPEARLKCYNMDAREFARQMMYGEPPVRFQHAIMNLPAAALEFLDVFRGYASPDAPPTIHCYCFSPSLPGSSFPDIHQRLTDALGYLPASLDIVHVRSVAPSKEMYCVTFKLPSKRSRPESEPPP